MATNYLSTVKGYTHAAAYDSSFLPVGTIHKLWYAQHGNPHGRPVIFLHGGPGGGCSIEHTVFFDPAVYRVVLLDQRGSGKSLPAADVRENTTQHLVADIETLREHLAIDKWAMVFGGSWGSTLALAYAQAHPDRVGSLVLRGIFTVRKTELANSYSPYGVWSQMFPEAYRAFIAYLVGVLKKEGRGDVDIRDPQTVAKEYYRILLNEDYAVSIPAAQAWNKFETAASTLLPSADLAKKVAEEDVWNLQHARMECHYFINGAFIEEGALLKPENLARIQHIPCVIVQGRYDVVCPPVTAYELHLGLPQSQLYIIPDAGHSVSEPGTKAKLIEVCDQFAKA